MSVAVAVFVKTPGRSPIKTRLAAEVGQVGAERFHAVAAAAVAAVVRATPGVTGYFAVAESPPADSCWAALPVVYQGEGGLGERMDRVYAFLLQRHGAVLLIGADIPQISPVDLAWAAAMLDLAPGARFIVAPAFDGGFWLMGGNRPVPTARWNAVRYGEADTGSRFRESLGGLGEMVVGPMLGDVDVASDLGGVLAVFASAPALLSEQRLVWAVARELVTTERSAGGTLRRPGPTPRMESSRDS